jgi:hypothetical protein
MSNTCFAAKIQFPLRSPSGLARTPATAVGLGEAGAGIGVPVGRAGLADSSGLPWTGLGDAVGGGATGPHPPTRRRTRSGTTKRSGGTRGGCDADWGTG